jgi:hypothetical protein
MEKRICELPDNVSTMALRIRIPPVSDSDSEFDSDSESDSDSDTGMSEEVSPAAFPSEPELVHRTPLCSNLCVVRQVHQLILLGATVLFAVLLYHV